MWSCNVCGHEFSQPVIRVVSEWLGEYLCSETRKTCPCCKSDDIHEEEDDEQSGGL